jgi:RIO kinase 1
MSFDRFEKAIDFFLEKEERKRDREAFKIRQHVFDERTVRNMLSLFNRGMITDFNWIISMGKEAAVLSGRGKRGEIAIKIYKYVSSFKRHLDYMVGDRRFPSSPKKIIEMWARKEYRNLARMRKADVRVPEPYGVSGNILVMQLIGSDGIPAPHLREVELEDPESVLKMILDDVKKAYHKARLVHADLSEYNILYWRSLPWMIDLSHAVVVDHPMAGELLRRDIQNIVRFFQRRYGIAPGDYVAGDLDKDTEGEDRPSGGEIRFY